MKSISAVEYRGMLKVSFIRPDIDLYAFRSFGVIRRICTGHQLERSMAVCGSVWQCVAVCGSVWQCVAVCGSVWQCVAVCGSVWQCVAVCGSVSVCGVALIG